MRTFFLLSLSLTVLLRVTASPAQVVQNIPNLQALPATNIAVRSNYAGDPEIRFSTSSWNAGAGPLELIAGEVAQAGQNVYQRIYSSDSSFTDLLAGTFTWHQGHNHFHFDDYALYTLQSVKGTSQRTSTKTSFCIMDTGSQNLTLPGAPSSAVYSQCGNSVQGMSVGWGDTYGSGLLGQEISLKRLKDGDYRLIIETDPKNRLLETDETDNVSCVLLRISVTRLTVDVLNPTGCDTPGTGGAVTLASINPSTGVAGGAAVPVTITGSGFANGMAVTFENGSGYKPAASNVVVVSPELITATVTIKKTGRAGTDNVWDVRVGTAILANGFTVQ